MICLDDGEAEFFGQAMALLMLRVMMTANNATRDDGDDEHECHHDDVKGMCGESA